MSSYCRIAPGHPIHGPYHDTEYGFPQRDETVLFERLGLEIFQAGLSWELILKRRPGLVAAFAGFAVDPVAAFGDAEIAALLANPAIIRNRAKVEAMIANAKVLQGLRLSHGGFAAWLDAHHPRELADWLKVFRQTFRFTGPEVVREFLLSTGYLPGAHAADCPISERIAKARPPWMPAAQAAKKMTAG